MTTMSGFSWSEVPRTPAPAPTARTPNAFHSNGGDGRVLGDTIDPGNVAGHLGARAPSGRGDSQLQFAVFLLIAAATIFGTVFLGIRTTLLREPGRDPERPPRRRPFSLGRTQQAFWVVLVVLGYVFVYLVTSNLNSLSNSALALIAISSGTALAGQLMTCGKDASLEEELKALQPQRAEAAANVQQRTAAGADATQINAAAQALPLSMSVSPR